MMSVEQFQDGGSLRSITMEEQRSIIRFLGSKGVNPSEIHCRMKMQYGAHVFIAAAGVRLGQEI